MNYVIVGCSAAGLAAAKEIRRSDRNAEIAIITEEDNPFYFRSYLIDYIAGRIDDNQIRNAGRKLVEKFDIQLITGTTVTALKIGESILRLTNGITVPYDALLIATGRRLTYGLLEGFKSFVMSPNSHLDAVFIKGRLQPDSRITICGGGLLAFELALALKYIGHRVTLLSDEYHFWLNPVGSLNRQRIESILKRLDLPWKMITEVKAVQRTSDNETIITIDNDEQIKTDLLLAAYPRTPNLEFLRGSGIATNRGIFVKENMCTNVANIFAAGDIAEVAHDGQSTGRMNYGWRSAARQGEVAGRNIFTSLTGGGTLINVPDNNAFFFDFVGGDPLTRWL